MNVKRKLAGVMQKFLICFSYSLVYFSNDCVCKTEWKMGRGNISFLSRSNFLLNSDLHIKSYSQVQDLFPHAMPCFKNKIPYSLLKPVKPHVI